MQFNDSTNRTGLIQACELMTGIGDAQISSDTVRLQQFTSLINSRYHQIVATILRSQDEWDFDDPNHSNTGFLKTYNLTGSQAYVELPLSDKILKVRRVEVSFDGTSWKKAEPIDIGEISDATDTTTIAQNFSTASPFYDLVGKYLYLYPIPSANVTNGLKVWVTREIDEFATNDTTQEPGFDEPFHRMLAIGASLDWAVAKGLGNKNDLAAQYNDYEARLMQYYGSKQKDRVYVAKGAYTNYE